MVTCCPDEIVLSKEIVMASWVSSRLSNERDGEVLTIVRLSMITFVVPYLLSSQNFLILTGNLDFS